MKQPKEPFAPYKPSKPYESNYQLGATTKGRTHLGSTDLGSGGTISLADLLSGVEPEVLKDLVINDIHLEVDTDEEWGYYDSHSIKATLSVYVEKEIPNPKQEKDQKRYDADMKRYEEQMVKYKADKKEFSAKFKVYEDDLKKWKIWKAKETLKDLGAE